MTTVIVHPGFVRTATTTLQRAVFPSLPGVNYLGMPTGNRALSGALTALCNTDGIRYEARAVAEVLTAYLDPERINLVSYENLACFKCAEKDLVARRLLAVFPHARIVFTIRHQREMVTSWYLLERRPPRTYRGFGEWLALKARSSTRTILDDVDFEATIARYEELFGAERVGVFLYETLRDDPEAFAAGVAAFTGLDAGGLARGLRTHRVNEGATVRHLACARWTHALVPDLAQRWWRRALPPAAMKRFRSWQDRGGRARVAWSPEHERLLASLCAEGNRRLMARRGLPLERHGYPL